ncbi:MAG: bis(5'-nucleosyl)-tetraphosphatase (symmetrical) YqeK [bacterium]
MLDEERYRHSSRVRDIAVGLAQIYDVDPKKAGLAGLLHDCGKGIPRQEALKLIERESIEADPIELRGGLIHCLVGAWAAENIFGVRDEDVLRAIRLHATGDRGMTTLDKIVYISDIIEPGREFGDDEEVVRLRELAPSNLEEAVIGAMAWKLKHLLLERALIHPRAIAAWNDLMESRSYAQFLH